MRTRSGLKGGLALKKTENPKTKGCSNGKSKSCGNKSAKDCK